MTDDVENLVLEHLRQIRASIEKLAGDVADIKIRVGSLEEHVSLIHADLASMNRRLDRLDSRVDRIERRLELNEAT